MKTEVYKVGVAPPHVIRGALLMRGFTIRRVADEVNVNPNFVINLLKGFATSKRVESYINDLLKMPVATT